MVYEKYRKDTQDTAKTVIASTASPYKFTRSVLAAIDSKYESGDDFELVEVLSRLSGVPVPEAVRQLRTAPVLHDRICAKDKMKDTVKEILGL